MSEESLMEQFESEPVCIYLYVETQYRSDRW